MSSVIDISIVQLGIAFVPVIPVVFILFRWSLRWKQAIYALGRMLVQLMLIGYVLAFIFEADDWMLIIGVLCFMIAVASWIATNSVVEARLAMLPSVLVGLGVCCGFMILFITQGTLDTEPWYAPRVVLPLAGMMIANAMNAVSIAAERLLSELDGGADYEVARGKALQAALIPQVNGLFAVGLVSLPGMMTGQILSGVSPLLAAKYQIVVMCMLFGAAGLSCATFLVLARLRFSSQTAV